MISGRGVVLIPIDAPSPCYGALTASETVQGCGLEQEINY